MIAFFPPLSFRIAVIQHAATKMKRFLLPNSETGKHPTLMASLGEYGHVIRRDETAMSGPVSESRSLRHNRVA
jgi:hypothetical protein